MKELDHLHVELSGRNLIEASAGAGKTYAIACLYLRLLIEQDLLPEQILVVTYTEAATEELRRRIRSKIREALGVFSGAANGDAFLSGLHENSNGRGAERAKARDNLDRALRLFDTASIFTIHGFCARALQDNAFESGSLYGTELAADQAGLLQEVADDFWRMRFFAEPAPLLAYALNNGYSPGYFLNFLKGMLSNPKLEILPGFSADEISAIEQQCRKLHDGVKDEWRKSRSGIVEILTNDKGLSRAVGNYHPDELHELFANMDSFIAGDNPFALFTGFKKFSDSGLAEGKKPKGAAPEHPFFVRCEELRRKVEERFLALRWELVAFARQRLPFRKKEMNIRFFDDLLNDLYTAICGSSGKEVTASLRGKYRAALIDEFQDTDPVQYDIFRKIYSDPACPLFLIGDPKQAIYSFRGADIFAYLEAAADVEEKRRFTLTGNWRSSRQLLASLNTIFGSNTRPFVFEDIVYHPVNSGKSGDGEQLLCAGRDNAPMQVWYLPQNEKGEPANVGKANAAIPVAVAAEIARLLQDGVNGKALLGDRPLVPGDIAVIVRNHRQAGYMQDALRNAGIPSVMRSDRSIFTTDEAREAYTLLAALAEPGNEKKVRAALVTGLFGLSGNNIALLLDDERQWEKWLEKFREYHQLWLERGFMAMSRSLMSQEMVRGRLLRRPDGERRLTNLLHCFEVIHQTAHNKRFGIESLLAWFGERVAAEEAAEEYQIRLETDEEMVRIVTVHVSKGLEYPVVFCPFMWGGIRGGDEVVTCHDGFRMVKDFGSSDYGRHRVMAQKESLAESLRLLYVALTRAKFRCYLIGGKITGRKNFNEPETSPLAYLLHASDAVKTPGDVVGLLAKEAGALSAQKMTEQLQLLAAKGEGMISVSQMPEADVAELNPAPQDDGAHLANRKFSGVISSDWRVASFTLFSAHGNGASELPDRDETGREENFAAVAAEEKPAGMNIFNFPKGAQAGIFLHGLFEELNFTASSPDAVNLLVEKGLEKYGYAREWGPCVSALINNVITTQLSSPVGPFSLSGLKQGNWITELEFFFPLKFITSSIMKDYFKKWGAGYEPSDLTQLCSALNFRPVQGVLRGFMDMVFEHGGRYYLLDWKSNHLGCKAEEYHWKTLQREMVRKLYLLQYLLYTVALNRYLSFRVKGYNYTTHFGGALYVFLRGVSPELGEEYGFFRDIPAVEMVNELTDCLIQAGG